MVAVVVVVRVTTRGSPRTWSKIGDSFRFARTHARTHARTNERRKKKMQHATNQHEVRADERLTRAHVLGVDAYLALASTAELSLDALVGQKHATLRVEAETSWTFDTSDCADLLLAWVRPRAALTAAVYADPRGMLGTAARARVYATRVEADYAGVRGRLLDRKRQHAGHGNMTPAQRTALVQLFVGTLVAHHAAEQVAAAEEGRLLPLEDEAATLPFVAAVAAKTEECLTTADRYKSFSHYTLDEWQTTLAVLTRVLNLHGDQLGGGLWETWHAIWSRLAVVLMDDLRPAERADPTFYPTNAGLGSLYTDVADDPAEAERTTRQHYALPLVAGGFRLRMYFLTCVEIVYWTHVRRLRVLDVFKTAARAFSALAALVVRERASPAACASAAIDLVTTLDRERDPLVMRLLIDKVYPESLPLSWVWCEEEELAAATSAEHSGRDRLMTGIGPVAPRNPDDVVRARRPVDFRALAELADDARVLTHVVERFLVGQEGTEDERAAGPMERMSVVLLVRLVDGLLARAHVPIEYSLQRASYIDELAQFGKAALTHPLPATPAEAYERYTAGNSRCACALVRLMRRTFLVFRQPGGGGGGGGAPPRPLVTLELPSFLLGLCLWLARAAPLVHTLERLPLAFRAVVQKLRGHA